MSRVYCMSDIHVSFPANLEHLVQKLDECKDVYRDSSLIVAGDVCESIEKLEETLSTLRKYFEHVFYCVGNHELWLVSEECKRGSSIDKFERIMKICEELGVHTKPTKIDENVWICPLQSWHEPSFDPDFLATEWETVTQAGDYVYCRWPRDIESDMQDGAVPRYFLRLNKPLIKDVVERKVEGDHVLTFSHFVPRPELINKNWIFNPLLPKVIGCRGLDKQIRELGSEIHVFAHTHIDYDTEIEGVRYIQRSFGYPRERKVWKVNARDFQPCLIFENGKSITMGGYKS